MRKIVRIINEEVVAIFESKQTEQMAVSYLENKGNMSKDEAMRLVEKFKAFDKSKNQVLLPVIAAAYFQEDNLKYIESIFTTVSELMNQGKIPKVTYENDMYVVGNERLSNWLRFTEHIHGLENVNRDEKDKLPSEIETDVDEPPMWEGNGIVIYDGNDVGKCIKYTIGGLTGKMYSFCIGQPGNTAWQSHRDGEGSSFYYILDTNYDTNHPLHIVVFDNTQHGIKLTDGNNSTGNIAEYGRETKGYINYLKSKGAPVEKLVHIPKTPEEEAEKAKLGDQNLDLKWFMDLSRIEKSKYVGRGHILSDEQFNFLMRFRNKSVSFKLLTQYVDMGRPIPESQYNILIGD